MKAVRLQELRLLKPYTMIHKPGAQPVLNIGRGWACYSGPVSQNRPHRHHAHQIAWTPDAELVAAGELGTVRGSGYVVCSGARHRVESTAWLHTIYLTPEMTGAQWCVERASGSLAVLTLHEAKQLSAILSRWPETGASGGDPPAHRSPSTGDDRVATVLKHLEQGLHSPFRAVEVAKLVQLSPSRFLHWFSDTLGLPFRAYVRWLRLQAAMHSLAQGGNLTTAAYFAGFADSAHLSRTFVSAFGITPSSLVKVDIKATDIGFPLPLIAQALQVVPAVGARPCA